MLSKSDATNKYQSFPSFHLKPTSDTYLRLWFELLALVSGARTYDPSGGQKLMQHLSETYATFIVKSLLPLRLFRYFGRRTTGVLVANMPKVFLAEGFMSVQNSKRGRVVCLMYVQVMFISGGVRTLYHIDGT